MSDLGQQLKDARLQKGLSLEDVQEMTKIRKRYLEAIEQGDFKVLPGSFYVRAFIKTYAEAVDLDAETLLQNHPKDVPAAEPESVMEPVLTKRSARTSASGGGGARTGGGRGEGSKGLSTALMWTFPILILIIVAIVYINSTKPESGTANNNEETKATTQKPADNATTKPADDKTTDPGTTGGGTQSPGTTEETDPATPPADNAGDTTATNDAPAGTDNTQTEEDPNAQTGTDPAATTEETGTEETGSTPNTSGSTIVTPAGQEGKTTVFNAQPAQGGTVKVTINASGGSWLEVYRGSTSGEKLYYKMTEEGDSFTYDLDAQGLYIKSGYSPVTDIRIDGQQIKDGKTTSRFKINLVQ
ncbi:helix-turn-helix domain-containing protein [Saccharibacillus sp. O23]|uniref:RodZ domain-containing protein n=1 Tax=Saccharibacillus sp. O23 TaxID=2009338 RepID=UPI000B4E5341|nr:RodZ domain-containing protein [Saccharibacillus sp. O23]OWR27906.1 helix-turn-helix domain-containing protein [Saccharibacillus sp. O23]